MTVVNGVVVLVVEVVASAMTSALNSSRKAHIGNSFVIIAVVISASSFEAVSFGMNTTRALADSNNVSD
jgi:hypothetical protein